MFFELYFGAVRLPKQFDLVIMHWAERKRFWLLYSAGVLTPLGVFNTFTVFGAPISLLWILGICFALYAKPKLLEVHGPYLALGVILLAKLTVGGSLGVALKYWIGFAFLIMLSGAQYRHMIHFLQGLWFCLPVCVAFAAYQWFVLLVVGDPAGSGAQVPVELWNEKGWHALLVDAWNLPRSPSFMFEPAYFAMVLNIALAGELFVRRGKVRWALIGLALIGLILANSRVGLVTAILIFSSQLFLKFGAWNLLRLLAILSVLGPLLPLPFLQDQILDFQQNREAIDISVFSRYISFIAFVGLDPTSIAFGVADYQRTFQVNPIFETFSEILSDQGSEMDPKSFLASNLFYFGLVGSLLFYSLYLRLLWHKPRGLVLFGVANIVFFNVYAYSWPLYWLFTLMVGCVLPEDKMTSRAIKKAQRPQVRRIGMA